MPKQCTAFSSIKPKNHPLDSTKTLLKNASDPSLPPSRIVVIIFSMSTIVPRYGPDPTEISLPHRRITQHHNSNVTTVREIPDVLQCKHMNTDTVSVRLD